MFLPWGAAGAALADAIAAFGDAQHEGLLLQRLAPYVAGRDQLMDAGRLRNIVSQPDLTAGNSGDARLSRFEAVGRGGAIRVNRQAQHG